MKEKVWQRIDELADSLWELALRIHEHPEVGFQEHKAAGWLSQALEEAGFRVQRPYADLETAFRAEHPANRPGPTVALLAEYDALPELGHACGHNLIAAIAVGAAMGLAPFKDQLPGRLVVLGTPAEEGGAGKILLIRAGAFKDIDLAMMVHPGSHTLVGRGSLAITEVKLEFHGKSALLIPPQQGLTVAEVRLEFHGKPAHASATPEQGINALDAVIQTFNAVNSLRPHLEAETFIHGIITHGGVKPNIVPEYAAAVFYVGARDTESRQKLVEKLENCARGAALATGARLSFHTEREFPATELPPEPGTPPEQGINALDAVIQTFNALNALRQHIKDGARIHGIITHGGVKPNLVPEYAAANFYVRAAENDYRDELVEKLKNCAQGAALATGAKLAFQKAGHEYKAMNPNHQLAETFRRHIEELGFPVEEPSGGMGSTDMGDVSWEVPAIHPYIRITEAEIPGHSHEFAQAARGELAKMALVAAAKALAGVCLDVWTDPELYRRVREEFSQATSP